MKTRLNITKREKILRLITPYIIDEESLKVLVEAKAALVKELAPFMLEKWPAADMEVLLKYGQVQADELNIKYSYDDIVRGELKTYTTTEYIENFDVGALIYRPGSNRYSGNSTILDISENGELNRLFKEYREANRVNKAKTDKIIQSYQRIINSKQYFEDVVELIPWVERYFAEVCKETKCIATEDDAKKILELEAKRNAA